MYKPETQWIGGAYPGFIPAPVQSIHWRQPNPPPAGHKRQAIIEFARTSGPVSAVVISNMLRLPVDSVRGQLRIIVRRKLLAVDVKMHPNGRNKINYYSGVQ